MVKGTRLLSVTMATRNRDNQGRFSDKLRDQDILKAFDFEATVDDPYLTVKEVNEALAGHWDIDVTDEAVRVRLEHMIESEKVAKRQFGPGVAYKALVGPQLAPEVEERLEERHADDWDSSVPLDAVDFGDNETA